VFLQLSGIRLFGSNSEFLPLENLMVRQHSFQKLTQILQGNKVLDSPVSNLDGFLSRDICVSSTQLSGPIWKKLIFSPF
jgi:hypothetical protein